MRDYANEYSGKTGSSRTVRESIVKAQLTLTVTDTEPRGYAEDYGTYTSELIVETLAATLGNRQPFFITFVNGVPRKMAAVYNPNADADAMHKDAILAGLRTADRGLANVKRTEQREAREQARERAYSANSQKRELRAMERSRAYREAREQAQRESDAFESANALHNGWDRTE